MNPVHPFPARMAPELASEGLDALGKGSVVLDPMCGSGTVLRHAVERGHDCVGYDLDPLSVLMSEVWTSPVDPEQLVCEARAMARRASGTSDESVVMPWKQETTAEFARFWFGSRQLYDLAKLSHIIRNADDELKSHLKVCLSRIIITKERGASLARDVSHSRPHRVRYENDFDVFRGFIAAAELLAKRLHPADIVGKAKVGRRDARTIDEQNVYDLVITSPPYLNAIDYLRGHRLALIWLGFELEFLRSVRSSLIGAERRCQAQVDVEDFVMLSSESTITERQIGWIRRYARDMQLVVQRLADAVKVGGKVVVVIGNSFVRAAVVDNAGIVVESARNTDLVLVASSRRVIPSRRRYLPPPVEGSPFGSRMREESVLEFVRG